MLQQPIWLLLFCPTADCGAAGFTWTGPNERNLLLAHHVKPVENPAPVSIAASGMAIPHPEKVGGHC